MNTFSTCDGGVFTLPSHITAHDVQHIPEDLIELIEFDHLIDSVEVDESLLPTE